MISILQKILNKDDKNDNRAKKEVEKDSKLHLGV